MLTPMRMKWLAQPEKNIRWTVQESIENSGSKVSGKVNVLWPQSWKQTSDLSPLIHLNLKCASTLELMTIILVHSTMSPPLSLSLALSLPHTHAHTQTHVLGPHSGLGVGPECLIDRMWPQGVVIIPGQEVCNCPTTSTSQQDRSDNWNRR